MHLTLICCGKIPTSDTGVKFKHDIQVSYRNLDEVELVSPHSLIFQL